MPYDYDRSFARIKFKKETLRIPLQLGVSNRVLYAGRYEDKPIWMRGVKLAPEVRGFHDLLVPIKDFGVPDNLTMVQAVLAAMLEWVVNREKVYVGCKGGLGRTGMMLALFVKMLYQCSGDAAIRYVRLHYSPLAVETYEQEEYVVNFDVTPFKRAVRKAKLGALWTDIGYMVGISPSHVVRDKDVDYTR